MSKKCGRKHLEKKRARQKSVKKTLIEKRLFERKERKMERERELAFEREFNQKQSLGLSKEEINERLQKNIKMLEALEKQHDEEMAAKGNAESIQAIEKQLSTIEEYGKLQGEVINLMEKKKKMQEEGTLDEIAEKEFELSLQDLKNKMEVLNVIRQENPA